MKRSERIALIEKNRIRDVVVVAERILNDFNLSALVRTAEGSGLKDFYVISPETTSKIHKAVEFKARRFLNVRYYESTSACFRDLKEKGFSVYVTAVDPSSRSIWEEEFRGKVAIVLGNEKEGVSEEALSLGDRKIWIPMRGLTRSFNVSVSFGIILYEVLRKKIERGEVSPFHHGVLNDMEKGEEEK